MEPVGWGCPRITSPGLDMAERAHKSTLSPPHRASPLNGSQAFFAGLFSLTLGDFQPFSVDLFSSTSGFTMGHRLCIEMSCVSASPRLQQVQRPLRNRVNPCPLFSLYIRRITVWRDQHFAHSTSSRDGDREAHSGLPIRRLCHCGLCRRGSDRPRYDDATHLHLCEPSKDDDAQRGHCLQGELCFN